MGEDFGHHRGLFNSGNDFQGAATEGAMFHVDIEHPFEKAGPAHAGSTGVMRGVIRLI